MKLTVLTFNIKAYKFAVDKDARVDRLVDEIGLLNPDILLLQEAFDPSVRGYLRERLPYTHTSVTYDMRRFLFFDSNGGLLTFSKYPIRGSAFTPFEEGGKCWDERICRKGYEKTGIVTDEGGIFVVNTHLCSWPENASVRRKQLNQILQDPEIDDPTYPVILAGDFNFNIDARDPESEEHISLLEQEGFEDCLDGQTNIKTFCGGNRYVNPDDILGLGGDQRLDGVFVRSGKVTNLIPQNKQTPRLIGTCTQTPISDHYGLMVEIEAVNNRDNVCR